MLSSEDEVTKSQLSESSFYSEFYKINIKFNLANKPTCLTFPANSSTTIVLQNEVFVKDVHEPRTCMIFSNIYSGNNDICVPKTLIDEDYLGTPVVYILNNRDFDISCSEIDFKVNQFWFDISETNIHTFPLFYVDEEDIRAEIPMISGFRKSTSGANALDVIMNNEYSINPLQILDIPCKFYFNTSTLDYQNLFLMRSRFSKLGIFCQLDQQLKLLRVINQSNQTVALGNIFLQLLLPTPLCFLLDTLVVSRPLLLVQHSVPAEAKLFHSYSKDRKNKY
jgi:hypothetical protein